MKECLYVFKPDEGRFRRVNILELVLELATMPYGPEPIYLKYEEHRSTYGTNRAYYRMIFHDREVHHTLCNIIEPLFDKTFICDSYANRKGKGTHAALKRFDCFKRKASQNGCLVKDAKDDNMVVGYALKADINHYFDTVDHEVLLGIIRRKIADEKVIWLIQKILNSNELRTAGKGMPIGNLTSQFFANVYLNELDYFVKHVLRARYYLRYVDDFAILDRNMERLEDYKRRIAEFLKVIKLELHPEKSRVVPLHRGVGLLGFRVFYHYRLPKSSNIRKFERMLCKLINDFKDGNITGENMMNVLGGWFAYAKWASTYNYRKNVERAIISGKSINNSTGSI